MGNRRFSHLAETLIPSEIVKLGAIIKEKISLGQEIFNYTIGDFDSSIFPIPKKLEKEIILAFKQGYTTYPPSDGDMELRRSVSHFIGKYQHIHYDAHEILIGAGGRPLIYAAYRAIVDKGDKVIYPVPSWNNNHYVHFTEGEHICIEANPKNDFMPTAAQIRPFIKGASLVALCSPLNPTGTVFSKEELSGICDLIINENESRGPDEKKLYLMYDQIYWTLTFGSTVHYDPVSLNPKMKDYTIFIDGISKSFAATGVRVGWAMGPADVIAKMKGINSHLGAWAPMAEQKAVARFLQDDAAVEKYLRQFRREISKRLNEIYKGFRKLKKEGYPVDAIKPQAAIYLTLRIDLSGSKRPDGSILNGQEEITDYILNEAGLAIVPFHAFGANHNSAWYRLSVGCCKKEEIAHMLEKLKAALDKLR
jgi:aspartate aminotransferase